MSSVVSASIHPSLPLIFPSLDQNDDAKEKQDPDAAWHFYSHSIQRNPQDLSLHTHRVFFAMQHNGASYLAGSLQDLFYILKDAGVKLRIRLLKASIPYLSEKDVHYFAMWIKTGINKGVGYKWIQGSVLTDGLFGPDTDLIEIEKSVGEQTVLSPLEEARSSMEFGQLEVAKKILIEALDTDPENIDLINELDYLSQYTKSRQIQPGEETDMGKFKAVLKNLKSKIFSGSE